MWDGPSILASSISMLTSSRNSRAETADSGATVMAGGSPTEQALGHSTQSGQGVREQELNGRSPYIYIACPYSIGDKEENVRQCIRYANRLAVMGYYPFAPLLFHYWDKEFLHSYGFWIEQSLAWLYKCDAVLRVPGESEGADNEVRHALAAGIPVYSSLDELQLLFPVR